jgi:hypothetical protein
MKATTIQSLALALSMASAHSIMQQVGVGSTINEQGVGIYMPSDDSVRIRCYLQNYASGRLIDSLVHRGRNI